MNYSYNPSNSIFPPVIKNIIIINALLFFATYFVFDPSDFDLVNKFALFFFESEYFRPYQYITHMFMHGSFNHIFFNMLMLWMFGRNVEIVLGQKRFLIYYFVCGLGAAAIHTLVNWWQIHSLYHNAQQIIANNVGNIEYIDKINQVVVSRINVPTVGASGAVFGILLAFGMLFPNAEMFFLLFPVPIKAKYAVMIMGALELIMELSQAGDNIAHSAHLGGMIFGFVLLKYWQQQYKKRNNGFSSYEYV